MATETFFKEIIIGEEAADRLIAEMEKPRKPYEPMYDWEKIERDSKGWWEKFQSGKLSDEKKK
ncbi:MAG: hypothetical protein LBI36_05345 [Oscillospiraceae bacterium]|nr:hypothetical protein [Oscillospiraceae bacterium]